MSIFDFIDYKKFVRQVLKTYPRGGHGQFLRIAKLLNIHTTMVTHIFKGNSNLSVEQALKLSEFFALSELESDYFVQLVQLERAANPQSRDYFKKHLENIRSRALNLSERLKAKKNLDEKDQAIFYSAWYYSGIRLMAATQEFRSAEAIAEGSGLPLPTVARTIEFLMGTGLLKIENGRYTAGEVSTFVARDSLLVGKHHLNWRLKAIEQLSHIHEDDLVFTNSIAVSKKDFLKIREKIVKFLEDFKAVSDPSPSEEVCFLNIDWRRLRLANRAD